MTGKLAIDGGKKVFETPLAWAPWPPLHPETEGKLLEIYRSRKWSLNGQYEQLLAKAFAERQSAGHCVLMANGTVTLECALLALGVGPGDEVIVPAITWVATASAVRYVGATPVIVDVEPDTLCMDPARVEEAITPRTKALAPVHVFASMADMDRLLELARKHGLFVVEDCAHAHGARWDGKGAGTLGDIGSFSFQQSKLMASGEGGACVTNDQRLAERLFRLSHIGNSQYNPGTRPESDLLCRNYRFTEFQAAILLDQLAHLGEDTTRRMENAKLMTRLLAQTPGIAMQAPGRKATAQSYYFVVLLLDTARLKPGITRDRVIEILLAEGVSASTAWGCPVHKSLVWNFPEGTYRLETTSVAEEACYKRLLSFPCMLLDCEPAIVAKVAEAIDKVMRNCCEPDAGK